MIINHCSAPRFRENPSLGAHFSVSFPVLFFSLHFLFVFEMEAIQNSFSKSHAKWRLAVKKNQQQHLELIGKHLEAFFKGRKRGERKTRDYWNL